VIASWLLDLTAAALLQDPNLSKWANRIKLSLTQAAQPLIQQYLTNKLQAGSAVPDDFRTFSTQPDIFEVSLSAF